MDYNDNKFNNLINNNNIYSYKEETSKSRIPLGQIALNSIILKKNLTIYN